MTEAAQRLSLVTQVAGILRKAIHQGEWSGRLPGERALSGDLQVSRPTLRKAIDLLRKEGLLDTSHGRGTRMVGQAGNKRSVTGKSRTIGFLCPCPLHGLSHSSLFLIEDLQRHLSDAGYKLEIHAEARFRRKYPLATLERLTGEREVACWILHISSPAIQNWFSRRGIPAVISKLRHEGVVLPSIDCHYSAIAQHAAARFISLGHRRIVFLAGTDKAAHDVALENGFRQAFQASGLKAPVSFRHESSVLGIRTALSRLFDAKEPPTGLMAPAAATVLTVMGHLSVSGIRVPEDISVICGMDDPLLAYHVPAITRYSVNMLAYARRLSRMVLQVANAEAIKADRVQVEPRFIRGETLGPAPEPGSRLVR